MSNAGGLELWGIGSTPKMLRKTLKLLKSELQDPNLPFGVDLLLPKVGKGARKTNYDYTKGNYLSSFRSSSKKARSCL